MNKKSLLYAVALSALISTGDSRANEIDQVTQMMNAIESKFGQKVNAILTENYSIVSKHAVNLEGNTITCKRSEPFEHKIDGDKTKTIMYHCNGELKGKYIVSQSLSKGQKLADGSTCKDVKIYYLSVVDGILLTSKAAGIEKGKNKLIHSDVLCDEIN